MDEQTLRLANKGFKISAIFMVGVLIFFWAQIVNQRESLEQQNNNQITVSGEGKVYAKPDIAVVDLQITTERTTVAEVTKSNTDKMNAVIEAIKGLEIEEKDIQTINYNLSPNYNWTEAQGRVFVGYTLNQTIEVKIRDFTKIGDVLTSATTNGVNNIGDLQLTLDNPEQFKEQARAKAIEQAKSNAQNLAKESGVKLGKIINIYENTSSYYPVTYNMAKSMGGAALEQSSVPTIQSGEQEVSITINLTYQVK